MEFTYKKYNKTAIKNTYNLCKKTGCYTEQKQGSIFCNVHFINCQYIELAEQADVYFNNNLNTKKIQKAKLTSNLILRDHYNSQVKNIMDKQKLSTTEIKNRKAYARFLNNSFDYTNYFCNYNSNHTNCNKLITHKNTIFCATHLRSILLIKIKNDPLPENIIFELDKYKNITDNNVLSKITCRYFCNNKKILCGKPCNKFYSLRFCNKHLNTDQSLDVMIKRIDVLKSNVFYKDIAELIASYI
jgi:hypothetical protein